MYASFDNGTVQVLQASLVALMELQESAVKRLLWFFEIQNTQAADQFCAMLIHKRDFKTMRKNFVTDLNMSNFLEVFIKIHE